MTKIFIIEDEQMFARKIKHFLSLNPDYEIYVFGALRDALQFMDDSVDCVVLDHHLPDGEGLDFVKKFQSFSSNLPVLVISGQRSPEVAEKFIERGAFDYLTKDEFLELHLRIAFKKINRQIAFNREYKRLKQAKEKDHNHSLLGNSIEMERLRILIKKAQETDIFVSITGETGSGKEVIARAIHEGERWSSKPFVAINMSAIPLELAESALFGHEIGAFTGAVNTKKGAFEEAADGILFMDEIADAPLPVQAKLLRAVQEKVFRRVGGTRDIPFKARIITATHYDLKERVANGKFREDLYYRLLGFPIKVYPLREHKEDILTLTDKFLLEDAVRNGIGVKRMSDAALNKLMEYHWPGNIRELKAVIQLSAILAEGEVIQAEDIRLSNATEVNGHRLDGEIGSKTLKDYTKEIIEDHMNAFDDDIDQVSKVLQIGKSTLYRMLKNNEISRSKQNIS